MTAALVDLCHGYVASRGRRVPTDVGERHEGVATPAWMLAVAVVRPGSRDLVSDTLELALAARVPRGALADCVAYVELAAALFAGRSAGEAVAGLRRDLPGAALRLTGEGPADALGAGIWALRQPGGMAEVMPVLAREATPGVAAAAGGLLGLRDGCGGMPGHWPCRVRGAAACVALAPGLVRARCRDHVARAPDEAVPEAVGTAVVPALAPAPAEMTPLGSGVTMCRPFARAVRGKVARLQAADMVGAR